MYYHGMNGARCLVYVFYLYFDYGCVYDPKTILFRDRVVLDRTLLIYFHFLFPEDMLLFVIIYRFDISKLKNIEKWKIK